MLNWVRRQVAKVGFTISIDRSNLINPMLTLHCERSGQYKLPKREKKLKLEDTSSRKCGCLFKMCGYFEKITNEWWFAILNGIHNHELELRFDGHLFEDRLREEEKKKVVDMIKSFSLHRNILMDLKEKIKKV